MKVIPQANLDISNPRPETSVYRHHISQFRLILHTLRLPPQDDPYATDHSFSRLPAIRHSRACRLARVSRCTGHGIASATGLPTTWSEDQNIRWKVDVPGLGWSSPVEKDGRIYLTTAIGKGDDFKSPQSLNVLCINAKNGDEIWNLPVFSAAGWR